MQHVLMKTSYGNLAVNARPSVLDNTLVWFIKAIKHVMPVLPTALFTMLLTFGAVSLLATPATAQKRADYFPPPDSKGGWRTLTIVIGLATTFGAVLGRFMPALLTIRP